MNVVITTVNVVTRAHECGDTDHTGACVKTPGVAYRLRALNHCVDMRRPSWLAGVRSRIDGCLFLVLGRSCGYVAVRRLLFLSPLFLCEANQSRASLFGNMDWIW